MSDSEPNPLPGGTACIGAGILVVTLFAAALPARAHDDHGNQVSITVQGDQRCIVSNGLPDHPTGQFPTRGNPNTISAQNVRLCVPVNPHKNSQPTAVVRGSMGVALNGVQIRPQTAEFYDPTNPRGVSRNPLSGWNYEGLGGGKNLGIDQAKAHVDFRGLYHYHGVSKALLASAGGNLIGYAADGFEIHYLGNKQTSSYRLKSGTRPSPPSGPGGRYDGTFVQDWEYVPGAGTLDICNGGMLNGNFVYFATDTYPFFPRCLWGDRSTDFAPGHGPDIFRPMTTGAAPQGRSPRDFGRRFSGPPPEAVTACRGRPNGTGCAFNAPDRRISGSCRVMPEGITACVPAGRRPRS